MQAGTLALRQVFPLRKGGLYLSRSAGGMLKLE